MTRSEDEFKVIKDTFSQEIKLLRNLIKSARPGHEFDSTEGYELRLAEMSRRLILIRPPITRQYDDHSNTLGEVLRMPISDSPGDGFPLYRSCSIEVSTPGGCRDWSSFHAFRGRYKYGDDVVNQTPPILDDEKLRDLLAILDQWEIFIETLTFRQVRHVEEQIRQRKLETLGEDGQRQAKKRMKTTTGSQLDAETPDIGEGDDEQQPPAIKRTERKVLARLATFSAEVLKTARDLADPIDKSTYSERTCAPAIKRLVELGYAEYPHSNREGVRLTSEGRRVAKRIADKDPDETAD